MTESFESPKNQVTVVFFLLILFIYYTSTSCACLFLDPDAPASHSDSDKNMSSLGMLRHILVYFPYVISTFLMVSIYRGSTGNIIMFKYHPSIQFVKSHVYPSCFHYHLCFILSPSAAQLCSQVCPLVPNLLRSIYCLCLLLFFVASSFIMCV